MWAFYHEITWAEIHALYSIHTLPLRQPICDAAQYAPTQCVYFAHKNKAGALEVDYGRWSLVPFFAKGIAEGSDVHGAD